MHCVSGVPGIGDRIISAVWQSILVYHAAAGIIPRPRNGVLPHLIRIPLEAEECG